MEFSPELGLWFEQPKKPVLDQAGTSFFHTK